MGHVRRIADIAWSIAIAAGSLILGHAMGADPVLLVLPLYGPHRGSGGRADLFGPPSLPKVPRSRRRPF